MFSSSRKKCFLAYSLAAVVMAMMVFLTIIYFQAGQSEGATTRGAQSSSGPGKALAHLDLTDEELIKQIKNNYPFEVYKNELTQFETQLKEKYEQADLVERVALEREMLLVSIRLAEAEKYYPIKLNLSAELIHFLTDNRNEFTDKEYNFAIQMLQNGVIESANKLLAQIYDKHSITLGGESLDLAARAIFLMGKLANEKMRYQKAYHYYRQAVKHDPENTLYLLAAADTANGIALYRKATIYYEAALHILQNDPDTPVEKIRRLLIKVAEVWESRSDMKKAKEYYQQAKKLSVVNTRE